MTFFVEKRLAVGRIRFGVPPHDPADIDGDVTLSTGPNGEFVRRHSEGYFFGDTPRFDGARPELEPDGTAASWGALALLPLGILFVLLGMAVLVTKGAAGLVEIILGMAM